MVLAPALVKCILSDSCEEVTLCVSVRWIGSGGKDGMGAWQGLGVTRYSLKSLLE